MSRFPMTMMKASAVSALLLSASYSDSPSLSPDDVCGHVAVPNEIFAHQRMLECSWTCVYALVTTSAWFTSSSWPIGSIQTQRILELADTSILG